MKIIIENKLIKGGVIIVRPKVMDDGDKEKMQLCLKRARAIASMDTAMMLSPKVSETRTNANISNSWTSNVWPVPRSDAIASPTPSTPYSPSTGTPEWQNLMNKHLMGRKP